MADGGAFDPGIDPDLINSVEELGRQLSLLRIHLFPVDNPTVRELSKRSGVAPATISNAESGRHLPALDVVRKIVTACAVPADDVPRWLAARRRAHANRDRPAPAATAREAGPTAATAQERLMRLFTQMPIELAARRIKSIPVLDAAELLEALPADRAAALLSRLEPAPAAHLFATLDVHAAVERLGAMGVERAVPFLRAMDSDIATTLLQAMGAGAATAHLSFLEPDLVVRSLAQMDPPAAARILELMDGVEALRCLVAMGRRTSFERVTLMDRDAMRQMLTGLAVGSAVESQALLLALILSFAADLADFMRSRGESIDLMIAPPVRPAIEMSPAAAGRWLADMGPEQAAARLATAAPPTAARWLTHVPPGRAAGLLNLMPFDAAVTRITETDPTVSATQLAAMASADSEPYLAALPAPVAQAIRAQLPKLF